MTETLANGSARDDASAAGLVYVSDERPGIRRLRHGDAFRYVDADGKAMRDAATLKRIRGIVIPPAWTDVWISPSPNGHIQATGRDARGRKQYRYHPDFRALRDGTKYEHIVAFGTALPKIRRQVDSDMRRQGLPREKVVAAVVHLLDTTLIRVGNASYAKDNGSFGLTTLRDRHVKVKGADIAFAFKGKSGKSWRLHMGDRRVAKIVRSCQELPGQHLFQYVDESGAQGAIGSADVNAYLRDVTGMDITAKEFRTWAGTVLAVTALRAYPPFDAETTAKANIREAIETVATRLGNTPTVCRKCYVHPAVLAAYLGGTFTIRAGRAAGGMSAEEAATFRYLKSTSAPKRRTRTVARAAATRRRNKSGRPRVAHINPTGEGAHP